MPEKEPQPVFEEYYMLDSQGEETSVFLSASALRSAEGQSAALTSEEQTFMSLLLQNEDIPFKLSEVRTALGSGHAKTSALALCISVLTKAPFLEGHIVAVVNGKTQFYGFLPECRNTTRFFENFHYKLQKELVLFTTNEGTQFTNKEKQRRHTKITRVVESAIGATVVASALIGYKYFTRKDN